VTRLQHIDTEIAIAESRLRSLRDERRILTTADPFARMTRWVHNAHTDKHHCQVAGRWLCNARSDGDTAPMPHAADAVCWRCYKRYKRIVEAIEDLRLRSLIVTESVAGVPHVAHCDAPRSLCGVKVCTPVALPVRRACGRCRSRLETMTHGSAKRREPLLCTVAAAFLDRGAT